MKIEYETTIADNEAWISHRFTEPDMRRFVRRSVWGTALGVGLLLYGLCYGTTKSFPASAMTGVFFVLVVALLMRGHYRYTALAATRKALQADPKSPALGPHTLEVTPDAITEACAHQTLSVRWTATMRFIRTPEHCFVALSPSLAIIVPLRAFASTSDVDAFCAELDHRIASAATGA